MNEDAKENDTKNETMHPPWGLPLCRGYMYCTVTWMSELDVNMLMNMFLF